MEEKTEYKSGDQGQISGVARPAKRSAAPSDESAKATLQPAHNGRMVRIYEVFCQHCDRSDFVGFDQDLEDAWVEAFKVGWKSFDGKWVCPDHSSSEVTDPGS